MKHKQKIVSLLLSACLLLGVLPAMAMASDIASDDITDLGQPPILSRIQSRAAVTIPMDRSRTLDDIVDKAKELPHSGFNSGKVTAYDQTPSFAPPYAPGSLAQADITDALNAMKMVRYLAGLPYENIAFTAELNDIAQHGAVLLAASNQFDHYPAKPADMPQDFFDKGARGCSEANISAGVSNISTAVLGFIADSGSGNLERAGHRRWILKPGGQYFGIGYARYAGSSYQGDRVNMHVFDGLGYWECESDSYIAWPSSGDFPIQYFLNSNNISGAPAFPWSVNLGEYYQSPAKADITLILTRARDGRVWVFDNSTPNLGGTTSNGMHFAVDNGGYGMTKAIIFRPDTPSLGPILDGDVFRVNISGIKSTAGAEVVLEYDINFFDLAKEMGRSRVNIAVKQGASPVAGASVTIDGQVLSTDENGLATLRVENNGTYSYTVSKNGFSTQSGSAVVGTDAVSIDVFLTAVVAEHTPGEKAVVKAPTFTEKGHWEIRCTECGELLDEGDIEKLFFSISYSGFSSLVAGYAANIPVAVDANNPDGLDIFAGLFVDGELVASAPATGGAAVIKAPFVDGAAYLAAWFGADGEPEAESAVAVPVRPLPEDIWTPDIRVEGGKAAITFADKIFLNGTVVTVGGALAGFTLSGDYQLVLDRAVEDGEKVVVTKVKYPDLFPSYSFTFSLTYSKPQDFRHIVIWDFKTGLSGAEKDSLFAAMKADLEALPDVIDGIIELRVMRDSFNPGLNGEGQIVLDAIFESQAAYMVYASHPDHLRIAGYVVSDIVDSSSRRGVNFLQSAATRHTDKYRHIVAWGFQAGLSEAEKDFQFNRMKNDLEALVGVIPGLIELNVARDHVNLGGNGQVVLIALFDSRNDHMLVYTPHEEHQRIAGYVVAEIVDNSTRRQANFYELVS